MTRNRPECPECEKDTEVLFVRNDTVRLLDYPVDHMNAYARVETVEEDGYRVSNMNMPFSGTLGWHFVPADRVRKRD